MFDALRSFFRSLVNSGPSSLDRAAILARASTAIVELGTFGEDGVHVFPSGVTVRVTVSDGRSDGLRKIVEHPSFDAALVADLANRLVAVQDLPARRYVVVAGEEERVEVVGDPRTVVFVLVVEGGDRDGVRFPIENVLGRWRAGRGPRHDDETGQQNDFILTTDAFFVSRAAVVFRYEAGLHLDVKDQGAALVIHRATGGQVRPVDTPKKTCPLQVGDVVELNDRRHAQIRVRCLAGDAS